MLYFQCMPPPWTYRIKTRVKRALGMREAFVCDTCKWNWRTACKNAARPNVTWCPEYKKR